MLFVENDSSGRVFVPDLDGLFPVETLGQRHHVLAIVDLEGTATMVVNTIRVDIVLKLPLAALSAFLFVRVLASANPPMLWQAAPRSNVVVWHAAVNTGYGRYDLWEVAFRAV